MYMKIQHVLEPTVRLNRSLRSCYCSKFREYTHIDITKDKKINIFVKSVI